jgi:hypothetical protein
MNARLGIISPSGRFYPCGYGCHEALARNICEELGYHTLYSSLYADIETDEKLYSTFVDTLYHKNWAIISFQYNGDPLFMIHKKYTNAQHEVVDQLVNEFMCLDSEQLSRVIRDNRENYNDCSCGFSLRNDLDLERIHYWLERERSDFQQDYTVNEPIMPFIR